jgi:hypothetical protein
MMMMMMITIIITIIVFYFRFWARILRNRVHNGSGAHPASYLMGTRGSFPGVKAARA